MKKKISIILVFVVAAITWGCNSGVKRTPGRVYAPDMAYSRAYETYADDDTVLAEKGIFYNAVPVAGTIKRGGLLPFKLAKDISGDTANYHLSKQIANPMPELDAAKMKEAERLFLVNCAICHGPKLDGNGPLYKDGNGPYPAAPKNLMTLDMPEGQMFYSITYGRNLMGSYASQLSTEQRWMVIDYIKSKQNGGKKPAAAASADSTTAAK